MDDIKEWSSWFVFMVARELVLLQVSVLLLVSFGLKCGAIWISRYYWPYFSLKGDIRGNGGIRSVPPVR